MSFWDIVGLILISFAFMAYLVATSLLGSGVTPAENEQLREKARG